MSDIHTTPTAQELKIIARELFYAIDRCETKSLKYDFSKIKNLFVEIFNPEEKENDYYYQQWKPTPAKNLKEHTYSFVLGFCDEDEWQKLKTFFAKEIAQGIAQQNKLNAMFA